jgi:hypothetical protein
MLTIELGDMQVPGCVNSHALKRRLQVGDHAMIDE